jgi:RNA polymerase subunit RPABC4/transcription elongation factor Spt4
MAESRAFKLVNGVTINALGLAVEGFLKGTKGMVTQSSKTTDGYMVQAKAEADGWKKIAGMDQAIMVQIMEAGDAVTVTVGQGKWSDKVGAAAIGAIMFAPLAITAGIGAYQQRKLPEEVFTFVEKFIISGGQGIAITAVSGAVVNEDMVVCPNCKAVNPKGQKFCSECGTKLGKTCPHCGATVDGSPKFCPECGQSMVIELKCPKCGTACKEGQKFCFECGEKLI